MYADETHLSTKEHYFYLAVKSINFKKPEK